jgi:oligopeptide/dipeptide ABC transporter ATP-binding protein
VTEAARARISISGPSPETELAPATGEDDVISVQNLSVHFPVGKAMLPAVDKVSMRIGRGQIVGLVGESGSGKSTLGMALLRMVPAPGRVTSGRIVFRGQDLLHLSEREMRLIRGAAISLVVQDALAVMNPVTTVGEQMREVLTDHVGGDKASVRARALEMLRRVRLPHADSVPGRYPHQLSGGMQQRVVIAQALLLGPELIVADEPTTALDVTIQAHILDLLREVRAQLSTSILFVTHDLATVGELCDVVLVMYAGRIVESGTVQEIFANPLHPYTKALFAGLLPLRGAQLTELVPLPGQAPRADDWPSGCRFHPRCPLRVSLGNPERCEQDEPPAGSSGHWAACHFTGAPPLEAG